MSLCESIIGPFSVMFCTPGDAAALGEARVKLQIRPQRRNFEELKKKGCLNLKHFSGENLNAILWKLLDCKNSEVQCLFTGRQPHCSPSRSSFLPHTTVTQQWTEWCYSADCCTRYSRKWSQKVREQARAVLCALYKGKECLC